MAFRRDDTGAGHPLEAPALLATLTAHGVRFVVIGGLAVATHGYVRATKDVDVVPDPEAGNLERLFAALQAIDARPLELAEFRREEMPVEFGLEGLRQGGNWALVTEHGRVDVMQWVPGLPDYPGLQERAVAVAVPEVGPVLFAGYDDLVAMKRTAGRPEDRIDLERLARARAADG